MGLDPGAAAAMESSASPFTVDDIAVETTVIGGATPCEAAHRIFELAAISTVVVRCTDGSLALFSLDDYAALLSAGGGRLARMAVERIADRHVAILPGSLSLPQAVSIACAHTSGRSCSLAIVTSEDGSIRVVGIDCLLALTSERHTRDRRVSLPG